MAQAFRVAALIMTLKGSAEFWAYIAVNAAEAERIDAGKLVQASGFDFAPCQFFKLFATPEDAVCAALSARTLQSAQAASKPTTWYVLTMRPSAQQWLNLFMATEEPFLRWGPHNSCWRVFGKLDLREIAWYWTQVTIEPIGLDRWTSNALRMMVLYPCGRCTECSANEVNVWKSKSTSNPHFYCGACWNRYLIGEFGSR